MKPLTDICNIIRRERLPAAIVDLDAFDRNLEKLAQITRSNPKLTLRIATKSLRVPELISRALQFGPPFHGLMCYSAEEARVLASMGFRDLLIAYPTVQPSDLLALREIHERGVPVQLVVDHYEQVNQLGNGHFKGLQVPFPLVIDIDGSLRWLGGLLHLGVRRSPVRNTEDLRLLIEAIQRFPNLTVAGAMLYEAQVAGLGDRNPFKKALNPVASLIRKISIWTIERKRLGVAKTLRDAGIAPKITNGGGTGSMNLTAQDPTLTEITAGSGLLCSHLFDYFSNIQFEPACYFALQASRKPDPGYVTCLGGGYIASGEPGWDKVPLPVHPPDSRLVSMEGCGEVQTPVRLPTSTEIALGTAVLFRHAKAGELAERFNEYILVSKGRLVGRAKTYRGLGHCFF